MRSNLNRQAGRARIVLLAMCVLALIPAAAVAATKLSQTVTRNGTTATVTYRQGSYEDSDTQIAISHKGLPTFKQTVDALLCAKLCEVTPKHALTIAHLSAGNANPNDVVLSLYSGGAHCCSIDEVYYRGTSGYQRAQYDFGDPGAELKAIGPDKTVQFVTADDSFAYVFSDYAESGLPLEVLSFTAGTFTNVTTTHPAMIRADAKRWWKYYLADHDAGRAGLIAAWTADEYNLGLEQQAQQTLATQVTDKRIKQSFVNHLEKFLKQHHYGS